MQIRCTNGATRRLTDEGDRVEFDEDGEARVKKSVGKRLNEKFDSIEILDDETEDDG